MNMIRKVLSFEIKEVRDRVLEFVGSTEDKDRLGDIIMASGWKLKDYKKNPVFLWAHQYGTPPVGKAVKVWLDNDRLKFHIQFATPEEYEFADTIYKLYKGGYLRATSVGFMPLESEPIEMKDEDSFLLHTPTRYLKQDLLELSACPVPANPNALAEARAKGLMDDQEFSAMADSGTIEEAEDYIGSLGIEDETITDTYNYKISVEKPYPNEHACRLRDPEDFEEDSFKRTSRKHDGKEYSVILGKLDGKMTEQSYRYDKEIWTVGEAKEHCQDHEGNFEEASGKQATVADELDYLITLTKTEGLSGENIELGWKFVEELIRLSGEIPVAIAGKIREVLNPALPAAVLTQDDVKDLIAETVGHVIAQARGITYGGKK